MSKKNNKATKARYHKLTLDREKDAAQKKQSKADKKKQKEAAQKHLGIKKSSKKFRKGGLRIKKGVTIKGIKIVDSESKKLALEKLQEDSKDHEMEIDEPVKPKKTIKKAKKAMNKIPAEDKMQD